MTRQRSGRRGARSASRGTAVERGRRRGKPPSGAAGTGRPERAADRGAGDRKDRGTGRGAGDRKDRGTGRGAGDRKDRGTGRGAGDRKDRGTGRGTGDHDAARAGAPAPDSPGPRGLATLVSPEWGAVSYPKGGFSAQQFAAFVEHIVEAGASEHYADAALYDYEYRRRRADVAFYRELAQRRGADRILELGAGSGRVTVPLARDGRHVVAVDRSPAMLDRLRARIARLPAAAASRITPAVGDLRTFSVPGRFPLVIAAFNVIEHLYTRSEVTACLERIAAHLAPGGAFAFDVQLPDLGWLARDPAKRWAKTRFTDPSTGRAMYYSTNHDYDPVSQIAMIRLYYEPADGAAGQPGDGAGVVPGCRVVQLSQRKFFPAELEALIAHAGFRVVARYGDFAFQPLHAGAESQVVVCEPVSGRRTPR